jgi:hypothetical protein
MKIPDRGCGSLENDASYMNWPLGTKGIPVTQFCLCPVVELDKKGLGIKNKGINIIARSHNGIPSLDTNGNQIYDVFDVVGREHYPYKSDFLEEGKRMGFNRRWPRTISPTILNKVESLYFLCSDAASYEPEDIVKVKYEMNLCGEHQCYRKPGHSMPLADDFEEVCTSMWTSELLQKDCYQDNYGIWQKKMPWGEYHVCPREEELRWRFGAFIGLPVGRMLITTPCGEQEPSEEMKEMIEDVSKAGFKTTVVVL